MYIFIVLPLRSQFLYPEYPEYGRVNSEVFFNNGLISLINWNYDFM